jgi:excisionase family DNA binding protein
MDQAVAVIPGETPTERHFRRLVSVREAAEYLGRTEKSVRHLVNRRKLRCIRGDGRVMLDLADLDHWIRMNRV